MPKGARAAIGLDTSTGAVSTSVLNHRKSKKPAVSRSFKAGLVWPVSRTHRKVAAQRGVVKRVGAGAPVFIASVVEFFAAELLEIAGNMCKEMKQQGGSRKRVMPKDVLQALRSDKELVSTRHPNLTLLKRANPVDAVRSQNKATVGLRVLVGDKVARTETAAAISIKEKK